MRWISWDESIEVPFDAAQAVYIATSGTMNSKMVGNGEHLFAAHVSGSVSSDDKFDVLGPNGERFEVKTLGNFRFNFEDTSAQVAYKRFVKISTELKTALKDSSYIDIYKRCLDISERPYIGTQKIYGRVYKNGRTPDLGLLEIVNFMIKELLTRGNKDFVEITLDENIFVSVPSFIKLCRTAKKNTVCEFEEIDHIFSKLDDECFDSPDIIKLIWSSIKPSEVLLTHCDSLVIVDKELGYIILDNSSLDEFVMFTGFSSGEAHFKTIKKLKELTKDEVMECNTTSRQLDFTQWFGYYDQEKQADTPWYCDCLAG